MLVNSRLEIEAAIRTAAELHALDADMLVRQCSAESSFNPSAKSSCGALGLFQLLPATAAELGIDPLDWRQNIEGAARYMAWLLRHYVGDYARAFAAYNWGVGHLDKLLMRDEQHWRDHLPTETANYLRKILPPEEMA